MSKIIIEQENNRNYLKCILEETEEVDEDCLAAISDEQSADGSSGISGIIPVIYSQVFQERILRFDVSAYISFSEYKSYITSRDQVSRCFLSILDTCRQADAYLIDLSYFLLEEEYIYVDRDSGNAHMILYPVPSHTGQGNFKELFTQMMQGIHLTNVDMNFYGTIMYELNQGDSFNLVQFRELLLDHQENFGIQKGQEAVSQRQEDVLVGGSISSFQEESRKENYMPDQRVAEQSGTVSGEMPSKSGKKTDMEKKKGLFGNLFASKPKTVQFAEEKGISPSKKHSKKGTPSSNFILDLPDGEVPLNKTAEKAVPSSVSTRQILPRQESIPMTDDEDFSKYGSTEDEMEGQPYLVLHYLNEDKYITVNSFPFEIGREGKGYRIDSTKTKVSRKHVEILSTISGFQVVDCSKLGTFLNGVRIPKNQCVALKSGSRLALKDEEFIVTIYE